MGFEKEGTEEVNWFTADMHFGHRLVANLRGYADVDEHDTAIMAKWHEQVKKDDIVWLLGDIAMSKFPLALSKLKSLPGRKRLVSGNHDPVHPAHRPSASTFQKFHEVFEIVTPFMRTKVSGHEVLLSHFPYMSVGDGDGRGHGRYEQYRLIDRGMTLLHGHTHSSKKIEGPNQIHVGWDAWNELVSESTIATYLQAEKVQDAGVVR